MPASYSPWLGNFTLNDTNAHKLSAILTDATYIAAVDQPFFVGNNHKCQFLVISNNVTNGGSRLKVGNSSLSATYFGEELVAGQGIPFYSMDANLINLDDIWVKADTSGLVVTVKLLTR